MNKPVTLTIWIVRRSAFSIQCGGLERLFVHFTKPLYIFAKALSSKQRDWVLYENPNSLRRLIVKVTTIKNGKFDYKRQTLDIREIPIKWSKKIILTTDKDLIADGVQEISEDFLQWFVKNSSCEEVDVNYETYKEGVGLMTSTWRISEDDKYKIIIPKEEVERLIELGANWRRQQYGLLEIELNHTKTLLASCEKALEERNGQLKRMFSEEEVIILLQKYRYDLSSGLTPNLGDTTKDWFTQFKKN